MRERLSETPGICALLKHAIHLNITAKSAKAVSPDGDTEYFDILAGVMQGDTLAPFLFVIVLDYALRKAIAERNQN